MLPRSAQKGVDRSNGYNEKPNHPVEHRVSVHAPSLLVALLAHEGETSECLARGRLPLGNLIGTAQDLAIILCAARTGWPEDQSLKKLLHISKNGSAAVGSPFHATGTMQKEEQSGTEAFKSVANTEKKYCRNAMTSTGWCVYISRYGPC